MYGSFSLSYKLFLSFSMSALPTDSRSADNDTMPVAEADRKPPPRQLIKQKKLLLLVSK